MTLNGKSRLSTPSSVWVRVVSTYKSACLRLSASLYIVTFVLVIPASSQTASEPLRVLRPEKFAPPREGIVELGSPHYFCLTESSIYTFQEPPERITSQYYVDSFKTLTQQVHTKSVSPPSGVFYESSYAPDQKALVALVVTVAVCVLAIPVFLVSCQAVWEVLTEGLEKCMQKYVPKLVIAAPFSLIASAIVLTIVILWFASSVKGCIQEDARSAKHKYVILDHAGHSPITIKIDDAYELDLDPQSHMRIRLSHSNNYHVVVTDKSSGRVVDEALLHVPKKGHRLIFNVGTRNRYSLKTARYKRVG